MGGNQCGFVMKQRSYLVCYKPLLHLLAVLDQTSLFPCFAQKTAPGVSVNSFCVNSIYPGLFLHQVIWGGFVGAAHRRDSLQGRGLFSHHLGSGQ